MTAPPSLMAVAKLPLSPARVIKLQERADGRANEAPVHAEAVPVIPHNRACRVDRLAVGCIIRPRRIEGRDSTVGGDQDSVQVVIRIVIFPVTSPAPLMDSPRVPWPGSVPAPGASKVVNVPVGPRTKPWYSPLRRYSIP